LFGAREKGVWYKEKGTEVGGEDGVIYVRPVERLTPARKAETVRSIISTDSFLDLNKAENGRLTEYRIKCVVSDTAELFGHG
jgi:hypothetical protein